MLRTIQLFLAMFLGWLLLTQGKNSNATLALVGCFLGAGVWMSWDMAARAVLVRWIQRRDESKPPKMRGLWRDLGERVYKSLRYQRRKTLDERRRLNEFLAAIQASPNGVVLLDRDGRMDWCNQAASEHLGLDPEEDLHQVVRNIVRDPVFTQYLQKGRYESEVKLHSRGRTAAEIAVQLFPYGRQRHLMLTRDITAIQRAERMRRDFVANVSHEIKTPLTVIRGVVETLQDLPLDEAQRTQYLASMAKQAQRMDNLVTDLLTLSSLEGGPPPPASEWHSAQALIDTALNDARALVEVLYSDTQTLEVMGETQFDLAGNGREIQSAIGNLVTNAVRYTPVGGRITMGWRRLPHGDAEFYVQDTGVGIAPQHLSRLSERFYRVDQSRSRETGGTGLGLAIVKHIAQRHGGDLRISSVLGKGSRFSVTFPARRVRWLDDQDEV
ncbi:MAG: Phosphate regulon sensor protein PhoR [Pseudomonadota bacterium]|jgi:two-component system phosphate regulon sensor histidine kinase PhoR